MASRITLVAAFVLAVCFVLPLSTCTRYVDAQGEALEVERGQAPPEGATAIVDRQIAAEQLVTNPLGGLLMLVCFVGPFASALHARAAGANERAKRVLFWIQPLLLLGAGNAVWVVGNFGETAPAAYVAGAAIASLAVVWVASLATGREAPA